MSRYQVRSSGLRSNEKGCDPKPYAFYLEPVLGGLARLLRMLGFDALYVPSWNAFEPSGFKGRIVLTRTRRIFMRYSDLPIIFIQHDRPEKQAGQVIRRLGIKRDSIDLFSRCLLCNHLLVNTKPEDVIMLVPEYVAKSHTTFFTCPGCRRIYWAGSHMKNMMKSVDELFKRI